MKTSFQISTLLMNISVSGPHGPVFPGESHQLSSFPRNFILFIPRDFQISALSLSFSAFLSPLKQVTEISFFGIFRFFVRNSKLISIASFLK